MSGAALAEIYGLSRMAISKKAKRALERGVSEIEVGGDRFSFVVDDGRYFFRKVERVKPLEMGDFASFPEEKRREAQLKLDLVRAYQHRGTKSYAQFIQNLPRKYSKLKISQRQFFRWLKLVEGVEKGKSPLPLLLDRRGASGKPKKFNDAMQESVVKMFLAKPHRKVRRIYEYLLTMYDDVPSYEVIRRFVERYKREHEFEVMFALSPDKTKGRFKPAGGSMSAGVIAPHQLWELDATPADVICSDGKRYTISGMIDVYSRRVVMCVERSSSSYAVGRLMRKAILKFGVPHTVKIDNGKEYLSEHFSTLCERLEIERVVCPPYSGEYKPHIERFFKTLSHELFEEIDGYIGHSVADREAIQDQMSHKAKMESRASWRESFKRGSEFAHKFALKKENLGLEVTVPLSCDELQTVIDQWIASKYEVREHSSLACTPLEKYHGAIERRIEDERELDILLGMETIRKVRKKGIEWQGQRYWSELFGDIVGERVYVLSDNNMGHVYIYSMQRVFICKALNPAMHDIDRSAYTEATKRWNKKVAKRAKLQEEIRQEEPRYMLDSLGVKRATPTPTEEERLIDPLERAVAPQEPVMVGEMPTFSSVYEKFCWAITNHKVDEKIEKLAKKYPESWELATIDNRQKVG